jgi:hypothetical protein
MTKIGTWNLQNLFRPGGGSGSPGDEDAYGAKLEALARTIIALDPDVLAIQEVGDPAALQGCSLRSVVAHRSPLFEGAVWARFGSRRVADGSRRNWRPRRQSRRSAAGLLS